MKHQYDLIVIGGGAAGLSAAVLGSGMGAKTLIVEQNKVGGDYTWYGRIPGKILYHQAAKAAIGAPVSFETIAGKLLEQRELYCDAHSEQLRNMGVDLQEGRAEFQDSHTVAIHGGNGRKESVTGRYFIIATGSQVYVPPVAGIGKTPYLTTHSFFDLFCLPESMIITGAGATGTEMAQALQRLGTKVTLVDRAEHILPAESPVFTGMLQSRLSKEGVVFLPGHSVEAVEGDELRVVVHLKHNGETKSVEAERLFFATGRQVNPVPLQLQRAGVHFNENNIPVNSACRTNLHHIYAIGDVTGRYQLTHMSEHMAKVAVNNALLRLPVTMDERHVSRVTCTDPEIAHVGATREELAENETKFEAYRLSYQLIDRAVTDDADEGEIHVYAKKWSGKILGADIVGKHAGELICQYALAIKNGISLRQMADTTYPYSTYSRGVRKAADQWYIRNQSKSFAGWMRRFYRLRGIRPDANEPNKQFQ